MSKTFKQSPRTAIDGPVKVDRNVDESLTISAKHGADEQSLTVTPYNASRLYAMIGLLLGIPHHPSVGKAIKL